MKPRTKVVAWLVVGLYVTFALLTLASIGRTP